jgi:excisionase family DNA binding protein
MSVAEAAVALGISRAAAYELVRSKELRALRIGRRIVIPRRAIVEFLMQGTD